MEVLHALVAQFFEEHLKQRPIVRCRFEAPLLAGVDVPEVDAGRVDLVHQAKAYDLLGRADLREFAHRLGAEHHVLQVVEIDIVAQDFEPVLGAGDGDLARVLALRRRVKDDALPAHDAAHLGAVQHIAVGLCDHLLLGIGKVDEVGRMDGNLHALRIERPADGARLVLPHAHAAPEGVLKAVKPHLFDVGCRLLGVRIARRIEGLGIAARSEFDHTLLLFARAASCAICALSASADGNAVTGR